MERTARGKFEGGDAAWEEERLGSYSHSELRLVEIQEKLCSDVEKGKDQVSMIIDVLTSKCLLLISNKSPTRCNNFPVYYPDVYLQLNMFRAFSRPLSGAH
jgi:hypothetical protein